MILFYFKTIYFLILCVTSFSLTQYCITKIPVKKNGFIQTIVSFLSRSFNKYWLIVSYNNYFHSLYNSKVGFKRKIGKIDWDAKLVLFSKQNSITDRCLHLYENRQLVNSKILKCYLVFSFSNFSIKFVNFTVHWMKWMNSSLRVMLVICVFVNNLKEYIFIRFYFSSSLIGKYGILCELFRLCMDKRQRNATIILLTHLYISGWMWFVGIYINILCLNNKIFQWQNFALIQWE